MRESLHYNIDEIVSIESHGFEESSYRYFPRSEIKTWYGSTKVIEEYIIGDYSYCVYTVDEFFEVYSYYVWGEDKKILRKPRIELQFTNKTGISINYDKGSDMQDALNGILEQMNNTLKCNNF